MTAAGLAFHAFISILPVLIAVVGFLNLVGLPSSELRVLVHDTNLLLPKQMASVVNDELLRPPARRATDFTVAVALAVALWSAIEAVAALQVALDVAFEVPGDRGLIGRRLTALPLIAVTLVLGGVASALLVLGGQAKHFVPAGFVLALSVVRYAGSLALIMLLLSVFYGFGPARLAPAWEWVSPGSAFAALGWVLSALAFSYYLDHFGHESRDYGALAGVAVMLLWLFLTSVAVLLGAELNRELERTSASENLDRTELASRGA
jgi:membrane protein